MVISKNGTINEVNPASEILFGMSKDILKTKTVYNLFENNNNEWEQILACEDKKFLREINALNEIKGEKIPVEISVAYVLPECSEYNGDYVLVIRDIHYQKELDKMRDDFIATLTHDLRTPSIAAIRTLEYFLNGQLGELNPKQKMLLETMKKSNEDMLGLVNTLLEVYKYESGKLQLVKTKFEFQKLIEECISQIIPIAETKKQQIKTNYNNIEEYEIIADRNEIRRVIINLMGNAVKFTQEKGEIEIRIEVFNKDLYFAIKDNGEGVFKKDIPLLFKRFSQGTQTKRSIGTGLGLYLSKQIIDAHGGKIWLESDRGKGSEFFFVLPESAVSKTDNVSITSSEATLN